MHGLLMLANHVRVRGQSESESAVLHKSAQAVLLIFCGSSLCGGGGVKEEEERRHSRLHE